MKKSTLIISVVLFLFSFSSYAAATVFTLGPGDVVEISVWKDPELTKQVIVQPDGYISFPLIGQIKAGGRTIPEIQKEITQKLSEYISTPTVTILPLRIESYKIYVIGKVNKPGAFTVLPTVNVMQALSMAGGTNPFAKLSKIFILRKGPKGQQAFKFNYKEVANGEHLEQNIELQSGDVVVVP
ncbi:MAG: polysaccharide export protein [Thermodesulfobacteria bacterium]|nr:polysaccharide export protein [Thermodesulfobacteriota bacterium]